MDVSVNVSEPTDPELEYLCVDQFLGSLAAASALRAALKMGLISYLHDRGPVTTAQLEEDSSVEPQGFRFLIDLLRANGVIESYEGKWRLSGSFVTAWRYRDLLEAKLDLLQLVTHDFSDLLPTLIADPAQFLKQSCLYRLFDYQHCFHPSQESYQRTRLWMRITTALTKYEAGACLRHHDFGSYRRLLDIGGNSGEFALRICKEQPGITATVVDLPLVCDIGNEHIGTHPEADRICFVKANALVDPLPAGFDLVIFKSMLHDWPDNEAEELIERATESLLPGGTLLIFERAPIELGGSMPPYSLIPFLLFFRFFRFPAFYEEQLKVLGYTAVETQKILLEMPFWLISARKPRVGED